MSDAQPLSVKWVIIGAAIIIGLNKLVLELINVIGYGAMVESMGATTALWVTTVVVVVMSFFVGGLLIGWFSPGETLKEPAIAATLAIVVNALWWRLAYGAFPDLIGLAITVAVGYGLGLAGAKVGERLQGDTTDKMRERRELG